MSVLLTGYSFVKVKVLAAVFEEPVSPFPKSKFQELAGGGIAFTITSSTTKEDTRARGRYANIKIENTGSSESWRFGTFQIDLQQDGRR